MVHFGLLRLEALHNFLTAYLWSDCRLFTASFVFARFGQVFGIKVLLFLFDQFWQFNLLRLRGFLWYRTICEQMGQREVWVDLSAWSSAAKGWWFTGLSQDQGSAGSISSCARAIDRCLGIVQTDFWVIVNGWRCCEDYWGTRRVEGTSVSMCLIW